MFKTEDEETSYYQLFHIITYIFFMIFSKQQSM